MSIQEASIDQIRCGRGSEFTSRAHVQTIALPRVSPELDALFDQYGAAAAANESANTVADHLEFAIRDGAPAAVARRDELPALRQIEQETIDRVDEIEDQIAAFEPRTVADAFAKIYFGAEEKYIVPRALHRDRQPYPISLEQDKDNFYISSGLLGMARLLAAPASDEKLFKLVKQFDVVYAESKALDAKATEIRQQIEADPACPPAVLPVEDREGHERWEAFMRDRGWSDAWQACQKQGVKAGRLAQSIFNMRANTVEGALAKLRIVHLAYGTSDHGGDEDLEVFQDDRCWLAEVISELEQIASSYNAHQSDIPAIAAE